MDVSTYAATGATNPAQDVVKRTRVADTSSRITFQAQEDLGGGLKAGVYCETGINIDNGGITGQADTVNPNTTAFCSREGRAYIGNNDVELRLGRQNVWWTQGELNQVGSNLVGSDTLTNFVTGGVGQYTTRGENMIKVVAGAGLGAFAGSEIYTGYMGATGFDATSAASTGEAAANPAGRYSGFKGLYTQGQIVGMIDYQTSKDTTPTATGLMPGYAGTAVPAGATRVSRDAVKYGIGYKYGGESLISFQTWEHKRVNASTVEDKDKGWGIVSHHDAGNGYVLVAQYGKQGKRSYSDTTVQTENGATGYTLGGLKRLSKRTHLYTAYHVIKNGDNGTYNMNGGNYASAAAVGAGSQVKILAFGLQHWF